MSPLSSHLAATKTAAHTLSNELNDFRRLAKLDVIIAGDDVSAKKPDPMIYNTARDRLGIQDPERCVVVEDSLVG